MCNLLYLTALGILILFKYILVTLAIDLSFHAVTTFPDLVSCLWIQIMSKQG